jgi:hypothetical protein
MNAVPDNSTTHNDATQTLSTQPAATSAAPQAAEVVDSPAGDNPGYMGDAVVRLDLSHHKLLLLMTECHLVRID